MEIARYAACLREILSPWSPELRVDGGLGRWDGPSAVASGTPGGSFVDSARVLGTSTDRLLLRFSLPIRLTLAPPYANAANRFFRSVTEDEPVLSALAVAELLTSEDEVPNWDTLLASPKLVIVSDTSRDGRGLSTHVQHDHIAGSADGLRSPLAFRAGRMRPQLQIRDFRSDKESRAATWPQCGAGERESSD